VLAWTACWPNGAITLTELAERIGITLANLSILKTNKARAIPVSTLDALCRELDCQPSDLLEWVSGPLEQPQSAKSTPLISTSKVDVLEVRGTATFSDTPKAILCQKYDVMFGEDDRRQASCHVSSISGRW
jgi:putative transcriptional regulator